MKKTFLSILGLLVLTMAAVAFIVPNNDKKAAYKVGDTVDNFILTNIDGNNVSLDDYNEAEGVIIVFTCNECPYSKMYEDRIIALDKKYKEKGYPVVAINPNDPTIVPGDSFDNMKVRAKDKGFTFPYLFDAKQDVYPKFGANKTPHVFLVSNQKKGMVLEYIGAIDDNSRNASKVEQHYVEDAIAALKAGNKPATTYTKAVGCSIKAK